MSTNDPNAYGPNGQPNPDQPADQKWQPPSDQQWQQGQQWGQPADQQWQQGQQWGQPADQKWQAPQSTDPAYGAGGAPMPGQEPKKSKTGLIIGIIVGVVVLIAAVVGILFATGVLGGNKPAEGEYGSDPALDSLYDACEGGDMAACDDLYWQSPIGSEYEAFAKTCGGTTTNSGGMCEFTTATGGNTGGSTSSSTYGSDPELDDLYDACEGGDMAACDDLYWQSPIASEYEDFARTCGGTTSNSPGSCEFGTTGSSGGNYGSDPELDALYDSCTGGDMAACDDLYWQSPIGSEYEDYSLTCGGRSTDAYGTCELTVTP